MRTYCEPSLLAPKSQVSRAVNDPGDRRYTYICSPLMVIFSNQFGTITVI